MLNSDPLSLHQIEVTCTKIAADRFSVAWWRSTAADRVVEWDALSKFGDEVDHSVTSRIIKKVKWQAGQDAKGASSHEGVNTDTVPGVNWINTNRARKARPLTRAASTDVQLAIRTHLKHLRQLTKGESLVNYHHLGATIPAVTPPTR